jgi:hypothetical protein
MAARALRWMESMYHHCIYCQADLGGNEQIEHFPVGRRLAYDGAKGRLWAVCSRCRRWNLTPIESRWEALEECERLFRGTRLRYSTDQIGLARLSSGLDLVRVGEPLRPELAAWRYGGRFGARRRRATLQCGAAAAVVGAAAVAGPLGGIAAGGTLFALTMLFQGYAVLWRLRSVQRIPVPGGKRLVIGPHERHHIRIVPEKDAWALEIPYLDMEDEGAPSRRLREFLNLPEMGRLRLGGEAGLGVAALLLPRLNARGASPTGVRLAADYLDETGTPDAAFAFAAANIRRWGAEQLWGDTGSIRFLPIPVRLGLEMAAHEEQERRALEGELAELEQAWREAEEVAAISDDLLLPDSVQRTLERLRGSREK